MCSKDHNNIVSDIHSHTQRRRKSKKANKIHRKYIPSKDPSHL